MKSKDDQSSVSDLPPSTKLKEVIKKLQNPHELHEYIEQLTAFNAHHLSDITTEIRHKLMLQGLDEDDLHEIHEFLKITFDGEIMKLEDRKLSQKRAREFTAFLNI